MKRGITTQSGGSSCFAEMSELNVVTGAFGYSGKYITRRLLSQGKMVRTLTGHADRPNPFGNRVSIAPFNFDDPALLAKSLEGADVLFNTYWIRFSHGDMTFNRAVVNTKLLFEAAKKAGVRRIVHVSITNASADSPLPYFRGKGLLEEALIDSGLSYAIIRPAVIFGDEDVLINNIAWILKRVPAFAIPGSGEYRLQPIYVEDMAKIADDAAQSDKNLIIDAIGPETYTFNELVRLIGDKTGSRARIIHLNAELTLLMSGLIGHLVKDVVLTREEVIGLMADTLVTESAPTGTTRLSTWLEQNSAKVGSRYASELGRHYR